MITTQGNHIDQEDMMINEKTIWKYLKHGKLDEAKKMIFELVHTDLDNYLLYQNLYNWKAYFRRKKFMLQSYGYFVWGSRLRQAVFQLIRPNRWLTKKLFPGLRKMPDDFFVDHYEYERKELKRQFEPRTKEVFLHVKEYEIIYEWLSDTKSKYTFLCVVMGMITWKNDWYMRANTGEETNYFPDFMKKQYESIVDGGGYIGDTALEILSNDQEVQKYYFFEPSVQNISKAKQILKKYESKVIFFEAGLSNVEKRVDVIDNEAGTYVKENENGAFRCISLDDALKSDHISFIKLDVEGDELVALMGGKQHIISDLPDMAICL